MKVPNLPVVFMAGALLATLLQIGCDEIGNSPLTYETSLRNTRGHGGWALFDTAPESYDQSRFVTLEEEAKVKVTGTAERGVGSSTQLYPVTVLSGQYAKRSGWVISTAIAR